MIKEQHIKAMFRLIQGRSDRKNPVLSVVLVNILFWTCPASQSLRLWAHHTSGMNVFAQCSGDWLRLFPHKDILARLSARWLMVWWYLCTVIMILQLSQPRLSTSTFSLIDFFILILTVSKFSSHFNFTTFIVILTESLLVQHNTIGRDLTYL